MRCDSIHIPHLPAARGLEVELPQAVGRVHELLLPKELVEQLVPQDELRRVVHPRLCRNEAFDMTDVSVVNFRNKLYIVAEKNMRDGGKRVCFVTRLNRPC